jgi:hypothetical protein
MPLFVVFAQALSKGAGVYLAAVCNRSLGLRSS